MERFKTIYLGRLSEDARCLLDNYCIIMRALDINAISPHCWNWLKEWGQQVRAIADELGWDLAPVYEPCPGACEYGHGMKWRIVHAEGCCKAWEQRKVDLLRGEAIAT